MRVIMVMLFVVMVIKMFYYLMNKKTMVSDWMSRKYNQNQHLQRTMDEGEVWRKFEMKKMAMNKNDDHQIACDSQSAQNSQQDGWSLHVL